MKIAAILGLLALLTPTAVLAQAHPRHEDARVSSEYRDAGSGPVHVIDVAARGREVARGPRGRVRTFVYRGRTINVIRRPAFVYPRGFRYRRWRAGQLLPVAFIAAPYFFLEYEALGLNAPPPGYRWVRHGPDLVLVNERTREIEDVAYGAIEEGDG